MKKLERILTMLFVSGLLFMGCSINDSQQDLVKIDNPLIVEDVLEKEVLVVEDNDREDDTEESIAASNMMYVMEDVHLRRGEGTSYESMHVVTRGTKIKVLDYGTLWSKVEYDEKTLYVASEFLTEEEPVERKLVVIDAGHQRKANPEKEPNGPGSSIMKAKVSSGTRGISTGIYEYELNLQVTLLLKDELEKRGYEVVLVRESHDVDISNAERAMMANEHEPDCFIRIHANGDNNKNVNGILTISQTAQNPYNAELYSESYHLSQDVLKGMISHTGAKDRGVWETDTMTGINWCEVPSTIVEMGFMSNVEEDHLLQTRAYQDKIVAGIADGLDSYFAGSIQR